MLKKVLGFFTSATSGAVVTRYITAISGGVFTILGIVGAMSPEQIAALKETVESVTANIPALFAAITGLISTATVIYAALTKSSSNKAAEAAKEIDAKLPASAKVEIVTPGANTPNIIVPPKP